MAKRYYIGRRLGTGSDEAPYYSELRRYIQSNHPTELHFSQQVIAHTFPWVLMCYDLSDTAHNDVVANVAQVFSFPSTALSTPVSNISVERRTAIRDKLEGIGLEFTWATGATTIREILEYIAHTIQLSVWGETQIASGNFDINKTVGSIPVDKRNSIQAHLVNLGIDTSWISGSTTIKEVVDKVQTDRPYLFKDNE